MQHARETTVAPIAEANATFAEALRHRDAESAASVYARDARLLPPFAQPLTGREEIRGYWQAGLDAGVTSVEIETIDVTSRHGIAYEVGRYTINVTEVDGRSVVDRGNYALVHERDRAGSWHRVLEMFSPEMHR